MRNLLNSVIWIITKKNHRVQDDTVYSRILMDKEVWSHVWECRRKKKKDIKKEE